MEPEPAESFGINYEDISQKVGLGSGHSRLTVSCISCTTEWLAAGTNSGSIYLYHRQALKLASLISVKEIREPLISIKFSSNGQFLAATSKNSLFVLEHNQSSSQTAKKGKERLLGGCSLPSEVTCLLWSEELTHNASEIQSPSLNHPSFNGRHLFAALTNGEVHLTFTSMIQL